jgi:MoaA/NifB/PqqE/SkfB family radical SAM enzyme
MCHVSYAEAAPKTIFDPTLINRRLGVLKGAFIAVGSGFEPMMHPEFDRIMGDLTGLDMQLQLITNGTYCDKAKIAALSSANMFMINFSFDGITPSTYEHIRRGSSHADVILKMTATREAFRGRDTFFGINSTVQRCNLMETIDTIDFWDARGFDVVRFLLMVVRYPHSDLVIQSLYPVREQARQVFEAAAHHIVQNRTRIAMQRLFHLRSPFGTLNPTNVRDRWVFSDHPDTQFPPNYRETYQYGAHSAMPLFDCRAAFNSVSILPNGDVQMCYKYTIGNLHQDNFEDIWFGENADDVRRLISRDSKDCHACDCYRYGIALRTLDDDDIASHFSHDIIPHLEGLDFDTGAISMPPRPPRLIATEGNYNIVYYNQKYIAVPHAAGPMEIDKADLSQTPGIFIADRFAETIDLIKRQDRTG